MCSWFCSCFFLFLFSDQQGAGFAALPATRVHSLLNLVSAARCHATACTPCFPPNRGCGAWSCVPRCQPRTGPHLTVSHPTFRACSAAVAPASVPEFLPALAELARLQHFAHAANLHETIWKQLPVIAENVGKKVG